jgi:hypothetical protein
MAKILISISKKSKKSSKNPRSAFLSAFMTELSSDGDIIGAFFGKDKSSFEKEIDALKSRLIKKMPNLDKG